MFSIYRSSAGSGKTHTLVREYLRIALKNPRAFKSILAITFTNKSTQEMKGRIINEIYDATRNKINSNTEEIAKYYNWNTDETIKRSRQLLNVILYNYEYFNVKTIDSFFQDIVKGFAAEMGIWESLHIETDIDFVTEYIRKKIIYSNKKSVGEMLNVFAENKLLNSKKWNFDKELTILIKQVFTESFVEKENDIIKYLSQGDSNTFISNINKIINNFEKDIANLSNDAITKIKDNNLDINDFAYGKNGVVGYLHKLAGGKIEDFSKRAQDTLCDYKKWCSKKSQNKNIVNMLVKDHLQDILKKLYGNLEASEEYYSAKAVNSLFHVFGITAEILQNLKEYRKETDSMLISDSLVFLKKIVDEETSSFIYEKVGNYYSHFLIDEFQDVSNLQWHSMLPLIDNSLSQEGTAMVVGDAKQSIYRWRGSNSSLLSSKIETDLSHYDIKNVFLNTNWRSTNEIVTFNNTFFEKASALMYNNLKIEIGEIKSSGIKETINRHLNNLYKPYLNVKQTVSNKNITNLASLVNIEKDKNVEEFVLEILENLKDKGMAAKDVAILVRNNDEAQQISDIINVKGGYNIFTSSQNTLSQDVSINIMINAFKILEGYFILDRQTGVEKEKENKILSASLDYLIIEIVFLYKTYVLPSHGKNPLLYNKDEIYALLPKKFASKLQKLKKLTFAGNNISPFDLGGHYLIDIYNFIVDSFELKKDRYLETFEELLQDYTEKEGNNITRFLQWWKEKGYKCKVIGRSQVDAINIMTIHQSKGLQFEVVIMPFCNWKLDHSATNAPIIWTKSENTAILQGNIKNNSKEAMSSHTLQEHKSSSISSTVPKRGIDANIKTGASSLPLYYYKPLLKSHFCTDYLEEKINIYFDNLNLLYVAFTRAKQQLHILLDDDKSDRFRNVCDLINLAVSK